ncbi:MAG: sigma-54-dependent Fis family transcriptional regulator [Rhodospirillales bacterium CG15_BIG_FIL_POST_REV_8_21_14_020_66_15]|nr:MAG: sigma-54-dependent Fis family transcriptional regulator [Rhodospirillales bacterium CG15_BIG_FIL_POST_REV_8_21_14_020_66_15]
MSAPTVRRLLLVEDDPPLARVYQEYLKSEPYDVVHAETGKQALTALAGGPFDMVVLDVQLPDMSGLDILKKVAQENSRTAVVMITAHGSVNMAVDAMREGAADFLMKPFNAERLIFTLRNALERQELKGIVQTLKRTFDRETYCGFIGKSLAMQTVYRIIDSAAPSKATVFITGESGTGKEVCAEAVHGQSPRKDKPFIALNCGAIPKELMESEIFGHVMGAFTGAHANRDGAATLADGGTLFLDEVCEMDQSLQVKLLRFIQTGGFQKVGNSNVEKVDVRFVCATNKDPWEAVEKGGFREDLYFRLHVIPIHLPPLRERGDDILDIAGRFLTEFAAEEGKGFQAFDEETAAILAAYPWPGNVRQLQNVIRNVVVLHDGEVVAADMLPSPLADAGGARRTPAPPSGPAEPKPSVRVSQPVAGGEDGLVIRPLWQVEQELINAAIRQCDGNVSRAAALLELSPSTVYRRLREAEEKAEGGSDAAE